MDKEVVAIGVIDLKRLIHEYMDDSVIVGNADTSLDNKKGAFKRLLEWLNGRDFNPQCIKEYTLYLKERGLQPSSIATDIRKYKAFTNWLSAPERMIVPVYWSKLIKLPIIPNKEIDVPSAELAEKIIYAGTTHQKDNVHVAINNEGRDAMLLMLRTGLRVNEVLHLERQDIFIENEGHEWLKVKSKGKKSGEKDRIPLITSAVEILKHPRTLRKGCYKNQFFGVTDIAMNTMLERGCKKLGVDKITTHKLRHIFGTELARRGAPSYHLQRLMRHSELETTLKYYVHLQLDDFRNTIESCHPLALKERSPEFMFKQLKDAIEAVKLSNDIYETTTIEGKSIKIERKLSPNL